MPYMFKLVNSGDGGVGKTAFLKRYTSGVFVEESKETIGTGFFTNTIFLGDSRDMINLSIWDLGGQKRFRFILKDFCMGSVGALLFFDITRYTTFENLPDWLEILRSTQCKDDFPILLIGNKCDLDDFREVEYEEAVEYAKNNELLDYIETSAKDSTNVNESVMNLVEHIYKSNKGIY